MIPSQENAARDLNLLIQSMTISQTVASMMGGARASFLGSLLFYEFILQ